MQIFHTAFREHWAVALRTGAYTWSTRGRTLDDEGFLHASRADQVDGVLERYYADVDPSDLLLLVIETDLLDVPWRVDPVGDDEYPHVYGPLSPTAVVETRDLPA